MLAYDLTAHASKRRDERGLSDEDVTCALGRGTVDVYEGGNRARFTDKRRHVVAIVDVRARRVVTVWRGNK